MGGGFNLALAPPINLEFDPGLGAKVIEVATLHHLTKGHRGVPFGPSVKIKEDLAYFFWRCVNQYFRVGDAFWLLDLVLVTDNGRKGVFEGIIR